jgi:hypothetical protein
MYKKENIIYPITPMVTEALANYWNLSLQKLFEQSVQAIFSAPTTQYSNDVKGHAMEKYI